MGSAGQPDVILSIESLCVKNRYLNATTYVMPGQVPVISTNNSTGFFNASPRSKERPGKKKKQNDNSAFSFQSDWRVALGTGKPTNLRTL